MSIYHIRDKVILEPGDIYIGSKIRRKDYSFEKSIFFNPFSKDFDKDKIIPYYRNYLEFRLFQEEDFRNELIKLSGKRLICNCRNINCHGQVILDFLKLLDR